MTSAAASYATATTAAGELPPVVLSDVARRDWALWVDWCTATGRDPQRAGIADLAVFLLEVPATTGVQDRRVRNIARTLGRAGRGLPRPTTGVPVRVGPEWATHEDALAALRGEWYPDGVAARRDAVILVLTAAGFTRRRITTLRPAHITATATVNDMSVDGVELPHHADPALCPRCALARWLQVLDAFADRSRLDVENLLTGARDHPRPHHDCADRLADRWSGARWVTVAVDRHGAIEPTAPLTTRAITGIIARRYHAGLVQAAKGTGQPDRLPLRPPETPLGHRPDQGEHQQLTRLWDQAEKATDELNSRILQLLADL